MTDQELGKHHNPAGNIQSKLIPHPVAARGGWFAPARLVLVLAGILAPWGAGAATPTVAFSAPTNGQEVAVLSSLAGNFQNFSPAPAVTLVIHEMDINGGAGRWWNGTNFQSSPAVLTAAVTGTNWTAAAAVGLPHLNSGLSYALNVTATNPVSSASTNITVQAPMAVLAWDPGQTALGTAVLPNPNTNGGNYWFQISPQTPSVGVWRTALNVHAGAASVYLSQGSPPTASSYAFSSQQAGSNGFIVDASQFSAGQSWYILVNASPNAQWNLVSGDAFVFNLGALAADASSSTNVSIGAEGMVFFTTTLPANTLAWQLWLNGLTNTIYVKQSSAADTTSHDLWQSGQMLVVPPYVSFSGACFVSVPGNPGAAIELDSRQQPVTRVSFNSFTNVTVAATNFPYVTFEVQVPVQQIAWQLNLTPTSGAANLAARRDGVPNEFHNDAYSDTGGGVGNSLTLVPSGTGTGPGLSDGTYYATIYGAGAYQCGFTNGSPIITPVSYVFDITNDAPNRVGWRFYGVSDINSQLGSYGWELQLSNAPAGSEMAIRRNAVPGEWNYRAIDDNYGFNSAGYADLTSFVNLLEQPGHQADIWYIGVYSPTQALGSFVLSGQQLARPVPQGMAFDGPGNSASKTNQTAGAWQYFEVVVPADTNLLGWDLRLTNVTAGSPQLYVSRDTLPPAAGIASGSLSWPSGAGVAGGADWSGCGGPMLEVGMGNPLQPGTYYIGVQDPSYTSSYTLVSRGIGPAGYSIPVRPLNLTGSVTNPALPVGEAAYYQVVVTSNTPDWKLHLALTTGDALLMVQQGWLPNSIEYDGYVYGGGGQKMLKAGDEQWAMLPDSGGNGSNVTTGTYYVLVASQGQNLVNNCEGTGAASYTLNSWIDGVTNLAGTIAYGSNASFTNHSQAGGTVEFYQFTVPAGVASLQVTLNNTAGSPEMTLNTGSQLVSPMYGESSDVYGNYGGPGAQWVSGNLITIPNPAAGIYSLSVYAADLNAGTAPDPAASYTILVQALPPTPVAFDGPGNSVRETNQAVGVWQYFEVVIPTDANLLGWDLRLTNVTAGSPQLYVSRDTLPPGVAGIGSSSTAWPSGAGTTAPADWSGCGGPLLEVGMGNPLQPGTYYIGVQDGMDVSSYSLVSRGIGLAGYSIPVKPLSLTGGATNLALPVGEAAYYQVVVPANTPDWKLHLGLAAGDALLMVQADFLPNNLSAGGYGYLEGDGGEKMNKPGDEQWALLPENGNGSNVTAGTYYVLVASQGQDLVNNCEGTGTSAYTLSSWIDGVTNLAGTIAYGSNASFTNHSQAGGTVEFYQFTVPAGLASIQVTVAAAAGNPTMTLTAGSLLVSPVYDNEYTDGYGNFGGTGPEWVSGSLITIPNPVPGVYSLSVYAADLNAGTAPDPAASYAVQVKALEPVPMAFDGPGNSASETNQVPGTWQYFVVVVPTDPNLLGWDLRLTNVTAGSPQLYVSRDLLPPQAGVSYSSMAWPSGDGTTGGADWAGCGGGPLLEAGMGNPLEAGTYYIGVQDPSTTSSYTLVSRGIGLAGYSIPVKPVSLTGSATNLALAAGEAAYYQVVVPVGTPDWKLHLGLTTGDALLMVQKDFLPSNLSPGVYGGLEGGYGGQKMNKPGDEQWALLPGYGNGSTVTAGTYYVLVASQGQNLVNNCEGTGTSSYTLNSWMDGVTNLSGTIAQGSAAAFTNRQPGGSVVFYQFTVPANTASIQVALENTAGVPMMTLNTGTALVSPVYGANDIDGYGNYGGTNWQWLSGDLITIPNPMPGTYSLSVYAADDGTGTYPDASYTVAASFPLLPQLSFSPELDTATLTNVAAGTLADTASIFYQVTVPATVNGAPGLGWNLQLSQSSGTPMVRVRPTLLPDNTGDTTAYAAGSIIIAPPYLAPGVWYVEVTATGSTTFALTTSVITTNTLTRNLWVMPAIGQTSTAPGLTLPTFGDTGVNGGGTNLPGDQGVDLAQGQYDFYAIEVPTNNAGLLRTELQAISGSPNFYLRAGAAPTFNHGASGSSGVLIDRQLNGSGTEYGNWVPLDGQTATNLTPGIWVVSVFASGSANARFRLQLSCGSAGTNGLVQNLPIGGNIAYTNQQLAGGDWRYYRVQVPTNAPNNWVLNWTLSQGNAHLFVRDTVPPGDGTYNYIDYNSYPNYAISWAGDDKNEGPYPDFASPGADTLTTPPLRPGATYYVGFWSPDDATFSIGSATNGGAINVTNTIAFIGGSVTNVIPGNGVLHYRINVPSNATRLVFTASNSTDLVFSLEQGTVALAGGPAHWLGNQGDASLSQFLDTPNNWPWLPGYAYFLTITNTAATAEPFGLAMAVPADLTPVSFSAPSAVTSGAPDPAVQVTWEVTNQGAAVPFSGWYDDVWFSTNGLLDANSVVVGNFAINQTVPAGAGYAETNLVTLPMNASGTYTLFLQVDAGNNLYEATLSDKVSAGVTGIFTLAATQPTITSINLAGTNLVVTGANGSAGATCYVLMSTNLVLPLGQWQPVATNLLDASGNFTITATNAVNPLAPQEFFILEMQ